MTNSGRSRRIITIAIGLLLMALGVFFLRDFILRALRLLTSAIIIAFLLLPLCRIYERRLSPGISSAAALLTAAIILSIILTAVIIPLARGIIELYNTLPAMIRRIEPLISALPFISAASDLSSLSPDALDYIGRIMAGMTSSAASAITTIADGILSAVVAWHLLITRHMLLLKAELLIPLRFRSSILAHASEMSLEICMYLRGQGIIAVCVGLLSAIGLLLVGISAAIPLGLTAGVLNMIPYLGPLIACLPVGLVALSEGFVPAILSIGVLIAVQQIDGLILSPRIVGSATGFSPITIMISLFAAGTVWGIIGMLAAIPALIIIRTCVRVFVELGQND